MSKFCTPIYDANYNRVGILHFEAPNNHIEVERVIDRWAEEHEGYYPSRMEVEVEPVKMPYLGDVQI